MEVHPGVFVSHIATDEWEYDPEVGGEMDLLCHQSGVEAGLSRFTDATEPAEWTIPERETLLLLEGEARIEMAPDHALQGVLDHPTLSTAERRMPDDPSRGPYRS
jgi:hypothetical protein